MSNGYRPRFLLCDSKIETCERRLYSTILAEFSWYSEAMVMKPQSILAHSEKLTGFETFLNSLFSFESALLCFDGNQNMTENLALLGINVVKTTVSEPSFIIVSAHQPTPSPYHFQRLCSMLCTYRFYEIIALRAECISRIPISFPLSCMFLPGPPTAKQFPEEFSRLQNWPSLVIAFPKLLPTARQTGDQFRRFKNPMFSLMHMAAFNNAATKYRAIEENFLLAAIHLAAMKDIPFAPGTLPDLPANMPSVPLGGFQDQESCELFEKEYNTFLEKCKAEGCISIAANVACRSPFQLALLISPLLLFLPYRLSKRSFHRKTVIDFSAKLGPHKSPRVLAVENIIWDAVFHLAEGTNPVLTVLCDLAESLPWLDINTAMSCSFDTKCFAPDLPLHSNPTVSPPQIGPPSPTVESTLNLMDQFISTMSAQLPISYAYSIMDLSADRVGNMTLGFGASFFRVPSQSELLRPTVNPLLNTSQSVDDSPIFDMDIEADGSSDASLAETGNNMDSERTLACDDLNDIVDTQDNGNVHVIELDPIEHDPGRPDTPHIELRDNVQIEGSLETNKSDLMDDSLSSDDESNNGKSVAGISHHTGLLATGDHVDADDDIDNKITKTRNGRKSSSGKSSNFPSGQSALSKRPPVPKLPPKHVSRNGSSNSRLRLLLPPKTQQTPKSSKNRAPASKETFPAPVDKFPTSRKRRHPSFSPSLSKSLGAQDNPIDVDSLSSLFDIFDTKAYITSEAVTLPPKVNPPTKGTKSYTIFDATGVPKVITPSFHHELHHDRFCQFFDRIEALYDRGQPLHIARPDDSIVKTFTYEAWKALTPGQIQQELTKKNVIITGWPLTNKISFDEAGITQLAGSPFTQISINDSSIEPSAEEGCHIAVVSGHVKDLLDNCHPSGKILNALDIPLLNGDITPAEHTSDLHAFHYTRGQHHIDLKYPYPTGHMRWALVGHENALTFLHIDCDGLCTEVTVADGGKVWVFLRPRPGNPLSCINFFLKDGFRLDEVLDSSAYDFEAVALQPGDKLFMMPCQPHLVFGYAHTICLGGHYYLTGNMQRTLEGLIHSFILHNFLTNTSHPTGVLLRRMVIFYHIAFLEHGVAKSDPSAFHLPDINTFDGLMNLLSACILVILGNVLDFRTYRAPNQEPDSMATKEQETLIGKDINTIPLHDRIAMCYARGVALRLIDWIRQCCVISGPGGVVITDLPSRFFVQIAQTLIKYKEGANISTLDVETNITLELLTKQIYNVVDIDANFSSWWSERHKLPSDSFKVPDQEAYSVRWPADIQLQCSNKPYDFFQTGCTPLDTCFIDTMQTRKHLERTLVFPHIDTDQHPSKRAKLG